MSRKAVDRVVVIGGGVAGLSAAHELAERGFEVHVYERRGYYGGKAASIHLGQRDRPETEAKGLYGEHGFRFFPGWYKHLPDTLKRIPYRDRTVYDNLVPADVNLLCAYDRDPIRALVRFPTNWKEVKTAASLPAELLRLGLTMDDVRFFLGKLWQFLTSSEERRLEEHDSQTWWEFMEADDRSRAFQDYLVISVTRNTVAANPRQASAYTIAKIALQTLFDTLTPQTLFDRVLNGPTNMVWIDPWRDYLKGLGVKFHEDRELASIEIDEGRITGVTFTQTQTVRRARAEIEYLRRLLALRQALHDASVAAGATGPTARGAYGQDLAGALKIFNELFPAEDSDSVRGFTVLATEGHRLWAERVDHLQDDLLSAVVGPDLLDCVDGRIAALKAETEIQRQFEIIARAEQEASIPVGGDYFVFALPVEQMAYYIHRSESLRQYDPGLNRLILLAEHVDWMAGIQFYLTCVVTITRGHIDLLDSEWALTAISQGQFWKDIDLPALGNHGVRSILSVDISAWDKKGALFRKEAYNCDRHEIASEAWHQLKKALNRPGRAPVLTDDMLLGWTDSSRPSRLPSQSFFLDDSIVDVLDRKKQAIYDRSRTVKFSAAELIRKQAHRGFPTETSFMYGAPRQINVEPLLVNRVHSARLRPSAATGLSNMFLAGDYVQTHTHLATMEAANESARAAVNEILRVSSSRAEPCDIWPLAEPFELFRQLDQLLLRRGQRFEDTYADIPIRLAAGVASGASKLAAKAIGKFLSRP